MKDLKAMRKDSKRYNKVYPNWENTYLLAKFLYRSPALNARHSGHAGH